MHKVVQTPENFPEAAQFQARAELWLPEPDLSLCLRGIASRDTRGVVLAATQRTNYFPATPLCSLVWYWQGDCDVISLLAEPGSVPQPVPQICFVGPHNVPTLSTNPGPMYALVLMLMPDAVAAMMERQPGDYLNQVLPAQAVLPPDWWQMAQAVFEAGDELHALPLLQQFLTRQWLAKRPQQSRIGRLYADWSANLALRAATSGLGRSLRQIERRVKSWTGLPLRELRGFSRSEQAFFDGVVASQDGSVNWSDVAGENGYSDQSHLIRQTRRITGFAPEELRQRILKEEGFWLYRLWGFSDPGVQAKPPLPSD